ncbi:MAG: glycosyltransferase family 4 protein [Pseudomonadota bacterium]
MRLLCLSYEYPPLGGGGAQVVQGLTRTLAKSGTEMDLVTMGFRGLPVRESLDNLNIYRIQSLRAHQHMCTWPEMIPYISLATTRAIQLARKNRYDINHTHFIFPDGVIAYLLKRATGLNYIITAHGSDVPGYNPDRFRRLHRLLGPVWKKITANAECIVCPSNSLRSLILAVNPRAHCTLIPNGIDCDKFCTDQPRQDRILLVTRMFARKGVQYLIEALASIECKYKVAIVGDGPYLDELRQLAGKLNVDVKFFGALANDTDQLRKLFETSRIFVLPSKAENFPIVLLEAMAAGLAIVTTRNTGCEEVVGDSALLVQPGSSRDIARALVQLMTDKPLRDHLGKTARKRLENEFDWLCVSDRYRAIYHGAAGG